MLELLVKIRFEITNTLGFLEEELEDKLYYGEVPFAIQDVISSLRNRLKDIDKAINELGNE